MAISGCLAHIWLGFDQLSPKPIIRATGTLCACWALVQLAATAVTICGLIPKSWAGWWVSFLLGGSAVEEVFIGLSCLLLAELARGMLKEARQSMLSFFFFISCELSYLIDLARN